MDIRPLDDRNTQEALDALLNAAEKLLEEEKKKQKEKQRKETDKKD